MLSPFLGILPSPDLAGDLSGVERAARRLRDEAGRYQPDRAVDRALARGDWWQPGVPALYRYRIESGDTVVEGLVGEVPLEIMVPHEGTISSHPGKPRPSLEIRPLLLLTEMPLPDRPPLADPVSFAFGDGWRHTVTAVDGAAVDVGEPVIADGHHRHRSALRAGDDPRVLVLVVGDGGAGLDGGAFHRVFSWAPPLPDDLTAFEVEPAEPEPREGAVVWVSPDGAMALWPRPSALGQLDDAVRSSLPLIARDLLYPRLGLSEADASYADTVDEALDWMGRGAAALMPPADVGWVITAARRALLMPPKATRFRPKPARGMVVRRVVR
jgi:hypothetical protein